MPGRTILVVEDEFLIRMTLAEALGDAGFEVLEAENGAAALAMLEAGCVPALLLTDVTLPGGIDGMGLVAKARALIPELPVIVMTGRVDLVASDAAQSARCVVLSKPYHLAEVCAHARRLTDGG